MPRWQPGQSGNPAGRPKGSISLTTLIIEELQKGDQAEARRLVRAAIRAAKKGDMRAFAQIIDRTDGRVTQALELSGPEGEPIVLKWDANADA